MTAARDRPRALTRPSIPPVAWLAAAVWAGCCVGERIAWSVWTRQTPADTASLLACAGLAVAGLAWLLTGRRGRCLWLCVLLAGLAAGASASVAAGAGWRADALRCRDARAREWTGIVVSDPREGEFGATVTLALTDPGYRGLHVSVRWPQDEPPEMGRAVAFGAILEPPDPAEDWARRSARRGEVASGRAWRAIEKGWAAGWRTPAYRWRRRVGCAIEARLPGGEGDLLAGVLLGDRRGVAGGSLEADFRTLGLSHLIAVSGDHLGIVCAVVVWAFARLPLPRWARAAVTVAAGAAFAAVTGFQMSALRALGMVVVASLVSLARRRGDPLSSLGIAVLVMLAWSPWAAFDVGLQLSVLAVAGLAVFGDLAAEWVRYALPQPLQRVSGSVGLTLVCQATTAPVAVPAFHMFSIAAPVANAALVPLVAAALPVALAGALALPLCPSLGGIVIVAAGLPLRLAVAIAATLARLPRSAVVVDGDGVALGVALAIALAVVWALWPRPASPRVARRVSGALLAAMIMLAAGAPATASRIVVMDVGQGDAILVADGSSAMLVDVGPDPSLLRAALARQGVRSLQSVVLTHDHDDHTGGLEGLRGVVRVGWVGVPDVADARFAEERAAAAEQGCPRLRPLGRGAGWKVGSLDVRVLWPPPGAEGLATNDTSVVMLVRSGGISVVLTGDAEEQPQREMASRCDLLPVSVLKVPHHGSTNGLTSEGLLGWRPRLALVSVGTGNSFGHPSPATMSLLAARGVPAYRTDLSGDLTLKIGRDSFVLEPQRDLPRVAARSHGTRTEACARILGTAPARRLPNAASRRLPRVRPVRPEAGVPDLRFRGVAAGARGRAPPRPPLEGGRPRLQLRSLRRCDR